MTGAAGRTGGRFDILVAAALFSTGGAAIKATSLTGWQVASVRSGIAAIALILLLPSARVRWTRWTVAVGAAHGATMILFVVANKLTTAASTIFLQSTAPLYVLLLGPWLLRERIRSRDVLLMIALAIGMSLFFVGAQPEFATAPRPLLGNALAAVAGVTWALTLMGLRWIARAPTDGAGRAAGGASGSALPAVVAGNLTAFLVSLPFALAIGPVRIAPDGGAAPWLASGLSDLAVITYLGVIQIGFAYFLLTRGMRNVPALEASLLILVEPALNPVWAWFVHGEMPGPWAHTGGAIIISATALKTWLDGRAPGRARSSREARPPSHSVDTTGS